jgi:hypothetical protein
MKLMRMIKPYTTMTGDCIPQATSIPRLLARMPSYGLACSLSSLEWHRDCHAFRPSLAVTASSPH